MVAAVAALLMLGAACQPPPPPPKRVTLVGTLERDMPVGRYWRNTYVRADPMRDVRVIEQRFNVSTRSTYNWRNELISVEGVMHAGSEIEFSTLDIVGCTSQKNSYTSYKGRDFHGAPMFLEVADSDYFRDEFRSVPYYDGFNIPK
jgi:hypothetical protein